MKFITDINDRERQRFIENLHGIREVATTLIEALESGDDAKLIGPGLVFTMSIMQIQDLFKALASAQAVDTDDLDTRPFGFGPDAAGDGTDGD